MQNRDLSKRLCITLKHLCNHSSLCIEEQAIVGMSFHRLSNLGGSSDALEFIASGFYEVLHWISGRGVVLGARIAEHFKASAALHWFDETPGFDQQRQFLYNNLTSSYSEGKLLRVLRVLRLGINRIFCWGGRWREHVVLVINTARGEISTIRETRRNLMP